MGEIYYPTKKGGSAPLSLKIVGGQIFWGPPLFSAPLRDIDTILNRLIELDGFYQICLSPGATKSTFRYNRPPIIEYIGCILHNQGTVFDNILQTYTTYNGTSYDRKKSISYGSSFFNIEFFMF
jgi:hypothetical protein